MTATRLRLFGLMVLRGSVYGSVAPFLSILQLWAGVPLWLLGPLAGVAALIALVAAPWWGRTGDMFGRRRTMTFTLAAGVPVVLALSTGLPMLVVAGSLAWAVFSSSYVPLADSLTLDRLGGRRDAFARLRVGASIGYIVTVVVVGALVSYTPGGWHVPGLLGVLILALAASLIGFHLGGELINGRGVAYVSSARRGGASGGPATVLGGDAPVPSVLAQVVRHWRFLLGMVGLFAAANAPSVFVGPRVEELGGSGFQIGLAVAAGTLAELPALSLMPYVLRALGARRTFVAGAVLLAGSGLASALVPTPTLVIVTRLVFGAGFAWMLVPSLAAIAAAGGPRERASLTGLHYATGAAGTLAVAILGLPLVGATDGTSLVLAAAALAAPIGAVVSLSGWPVAAISATAPRASAIEVGEGSGEVEGAPEAVAAPV